VDNKDMKKSCLYRGITAFLVIASSILLYFIIERIDVVGNAIGKVFDILSPVIFGLVISYLLNPMVDFFNKLFNKCFIRFIKKEKTANAVSNLTSVIVSLLIFIIIIAGVILLIIPQLVTSVTKIAKIAPSKMDSLISWGDRFLKENKLAKTAFEKVLTFEKKWFETKFAGYVNRVAEYFATGVMGLLAFLKNFFIGLLIAIYVLYNKTRFGNRTRKLMFALFKENKVKNILSVSHKVNEVFSGFIYGKLIDSLIIGVICFVGVTVMGMPYTVLVAVIVGVTNIIPVFGPYIGAIPCSVIILLTNPIKGLYFILFIILLQTVDGNFIGPKILGDKTGLETFWVIVAIIVGGGMFGVLGMIIGVPLFAILYYFASMATNALLNRKKLSTSSDDYSADKFIEKEISEEEKDA